MKFNKKLFIRVLILVLGFAFLVLGFVLPTPHDWLPIPSATCAIVSACFIGYWIFDVFIKP